MRWIPLLRAALLPLVAMTSHPLTTKLAAQGVPIGFPEDFALAQDRAALLDRLIPGSEDDYYYRCLERQHTGALADVPALLRAWELRHGRTARLIEIENRQALLSFPRDAKAAFDLLRERMGLRFDHQRRVPGAAPDLPTRLDPAQYSVATLTRTALQRHPKSVDGFRDSAFDFLLASGDLDADRLRDLLKRLQRPDVPNLPALIVADLKHEDSRGFGSLGIHRLLLLDQLDECVRLMPELLADSDFPDIYARRLWPGGDVDLRSDSAEREAFLTRLEAFANRLPAVHNSFKAHVLYHRLAHDRQRGVFAKDRFLAYLRLPRRSSYVEPEFLRRTQRGDHYADLGRQYATGMLPVQDDEVLVRDYFEHFFATEDDYRPYTELVRESWLRRVFAETKLLLGTGDSPERWYSLLGDPVYLEQLRTRVEIEFAPTQPVFYGAQDRVSIDVDLKNVGTLLVKVFEINAFNYYVENGKQVDATIPLDGLVANQELRFEYGDSPLRRIRRRFEFPNLDRPGVYVVELIGNGLSSRAVIHKGRLFETERIGAAGHVFTVRDDGGRIVPDATLWLAGREFRADQNGEIAVPFSTQPGPQKIVLRGNGIATLEQFEHRAEGYELRAGILLEREELLSEGTAHVTVRPRLVVAGTDVPVSLALLKDVRLSVATVDVHGVASSQELRDFELAADRDAVHEIRVPRELQRIEITLRARIENLSRGETQDLQAGPETFGMNGIDATADTSCALLSRTAAGFVLDVRGKNGEPVKDRAVHVALQHRQFTDAAHFDLKTDAAGRVNLGPLDGITSVRLTGVSPNDSTWTLPQDRRTWPARLTGRTGDTLRVAWLGDQRRLDRSAVSLLEVCGGVFVRDRFTNLGLRDGFLELRDLPAGDYDLLLEQEGQRIAVSITTGAVRDDRLVGDHRMLERGADAPLHVTGIAISDANVEVRLANARPDARVHVVATRYQRAWPASPDIGASPNALPAIVELDHPESTYDSGREIGDEYRYILERRLAARFPGNMLQRPGLVLNPWALDEADTLAQAEGGAGGRFGAPSGRARRGRAEGESGGEWGGAVSPSTYPNLDFLPRAAAVLLNLRPDADGVVRIPRADLGDGQELHVFAVDLTDTVYRTVALPERPLQPRDRRLILALDAERHYTEQRRIEFVAAGAQATVEDAASASVEVYGSLADVHRLFGTLSGNADLQQFAFVLRWPQLDDTEKRALYSEHACHELHFFLWNKDRAFFDAVVRPYLQNKLHKTFMDDWLLGNELSGYLEPWAFARLNAVERILLARRITDERDPTTRQLRELLDMQPPDVTATLLLFDATLQAGALDARRQLGDQLRALRGALRESEELARAAVPAPAPPPGAPPARDGAEDDKAKDERQNLEPADAPAAAAGGLVEEMRRDADRRTQGRAFFRGPEPTRLWVENNYWHRRIEEQVASLIDVNAFWLDFATATPGQPFTSEHLASAAKDSSFAEMMLALAVLDLPFQATEPASTIDGSRLTLRAETPLLLVSKEVRPASPAADATPILVSQNVFRLDDRYRYEGNQQVEKFIDGELLTGIAYGAHVVLTNPTSAAQTLELLLQIPRGALPLDSGYETRTVSVQLGAYSTTTAEYHFYFPAPGDFSHFPVHVARDGQLSAFAAPAVRHVVAVPTVVDTTSWEHVSQSGTPDEVFAYLESANLQRVQIADLAWRMRDQGFFRRATDWLRAHHTYDGTLWSYGVLHGDARVVREWLEHQDGFVARCGSALESQLLTIDPIERHTWQQIDYSPLFNARAHRFGDHRQILNGSLAGQYLRLLDILVHRPRLDSEDWLTTTYYLLLQDRIEDALAAFRKVEPRELPSQIQYDYMRAYLDFFSADHAVARGIAERYRDHPVTRWRDLFREVLAQLDEAEGKTAGRTGDTESPGAGRPDLAATEPTLELSVDGRRLKLRYGNLGECEVAYYRMDIEFLFSTNPFVQQGSGSFQFIRPNRSDPLRLPAGQSELTFELPEEFANANVLVEVRGAGIVRRQACYANSLAVQVIEGYGQVRVTDAGTGRPLPKVYVKVYAREPGGRVRFHKDGYTDLRGRFDYVSVSAEGQTGAERYAILILSDDAGAEIREAAPPKQ
ncbi:MAG: hypothetical protein IPM29_26400 [Planctomycetes bacterium]|nr:hypothetical protein [Planctomycetota bacterium]